MPTRFGRPAATIRTSPHRQPPLNWSITRLLRSLGPDWIRTRLIGDDPSRGEPDRRNEPPPQPDHARGRAGDAARALLRPRLRARPDPVHGADGRKRDAGQGLAQGSLVLALLWWAWTGICLADERRRSRGGRSAARPGRGDGGAADRRAGRAAKRSAIGAVEFAVAYGAVRAAHIGAVPRSPAATTRGCAARPAGSAVGPAVGVALLLAGALIGGPGAGRALGRSPRSSTSASPYFFGSEGWRLVPGHFAERHGLVIIVALGESIVALGVGAEVGLTFGVTVGRDPRGRARLRALVDLLRHRRDRQRAAARPRRRTAGSRTSSPGTSTPTSTSCSSRASCSPHSACTRCSPIPTRNSRRCRRSRCSAESRSTCSGHVAIRLRGAHTLNRQRLGLAIVLFALIPVAMSTCRRRRTGDRHGAARGDDRLRDSWLRGGPARGTP